MKRFTFTVQPYGQKVIVYYQYTTAVAERIAWQDIRKQVFDRALWQCEYPGCSRPATEIAHRIANTKANAKAYGKEVLSHSANLAASCRMHNDYFNCGNRPDAVRAILEKIQGEL